MTTEPASSEEVESVVVKERTCERVGVSSDDPQPTPPPRKRKKAKLKQQIEHQLQQKIKEQEETIVTSGSQGGSEQDRKEEGIDERASEQEGIEIVKAVEIEEVVEGNETVKEEALPAEDVVEDTSDCIAEEVIGTQTVSEEIASSKISEDEKEIDDDIGEEAVEVGKVEGFQVVDALESDGEEECVVTEHREKDDDGVREGLAVAADDVIGEGGESVMVGVAEEDVETTSEKKEMLKKPRRKKKHFR